MDATTIIKLLSESIAGAEFEAGASTDQPTIYVNRERLIDSCRVLRDDPRLRCTLLADLTAVDWWPREPRFEVVYILAALGTAGGPRSRMRLKVRASGGDPRVPTVTPIWPGAEWPEREVWDLFGIEFIGHPDLRRVMMPDDWEGHPLRKDYPVQISKAAATTEPLQLSAEEFAANIAAARRASRQPPESDRDGDTREGTDRK
jgi:NADH-quinone oxidoreductase subunit C